MLAYLKKDKELLGLIRAVSVEVVPWSNNANVDTLAKLASTGMQRHSVSGILSQTQHEITTKGNRVES